MSEKEDARAFLDGLAERLAKQAELSSPRELHLRVRETVAGASGNYSRRHLNSPEKAFLNTYVVPQLFESVVEAGLSDDDARRALLVEHYPNMLEYAEESACRTARHPFAKDLRARGETYAQWAQGKMVQSCPDLGLRAPHKVVFEGKYFAKGGREYAQRELVSYLYQTFFYRGLSKVPATNKKAAWEFEYGCLVAYDASRAGTLREAWRSLAPKIRKSFWDDANLYVMILRGDE